MVVYYFSISIVSIQLGSIPLLISFNSSDNLALRSAIVSPLFFIFYFLGGVRSPWIERLLFAWGVRWRRISLCSKEMSDLSVKSFSP